MSTDNLVVRKNGPNRTLIARATDGVGFRELALPLPKRPAQIQVEWRGSSTEAGDGLLVLRVRDPKTGEATEALLENLSTGFDTVELLRLGTAEPTAAGISGAIRFDAFMSWR